MWSAMTMFLKVTEAIVVMSSGDRIVGLHCTIKSLRIGLLAFSRLLIQPVLQVSHTTLAVALSPRVGQAIVSPLWVLRLFAISWALRAPPIHSLQRCSPLILTEVAQNPHCLRIWVFYNFSQLRGDITVAPPGVDES